MRRAFKYRIYPTQEQMVLINKTIGDARKIYNLLLADYKQQLDEKVKKPTLKEVSHFKAMEDYHYLKEVDSLALSNAKQNLRSALDNFFKSRKGKRKGKKMGFPKFHSKNKSKWRYTTNNQNGTISLDEENSLLKLPKLKWINIELHRPLEGKITSCSIERTKNNKYFASLGVEMDDYTPYSQKPVNEQRVVGIDMSFSQFAIDSDDKPDHMKSKYVRQYRTHEKKLARLNRRLSKKQKDSKNREKARVRYANLHWHVSNCRKDFCHKQALHYARDYDVVVLEDINMQQMSKQLNHGKSVMDLGFGMFKQFLAYKCDKYGTLLVKADKWFASSKTCNDCGYVKKDLQLSDREWVCPECGCWHDRDINAARNLRDYYYNVILNTAGTAGIDACGDLTSASEILFSEVSQVDEARSPSV